MRRKNQNESANSRREFIVSQQGTTKEQQMWCAAGYNSVDIGSATVLDLFFDMFSAFSLRVL